MSSIPQRLYNEVMMADNFTCVYCGVRTPEITIDHFVPRSQNGPDNLHNLFCACTNCNFRKGDRMAHEASMVPRFGRFLRPATRKALAQPQRRVAVAIDPERSTKIIALARERKDDGKYRYSANEITRMVGGAAAVVKGLIAAERQAIAHQ